MKSYCGVSNRESTLDTVMKVLDCFIQQNEDVDIDNIPQVMKRLVDERIQENPDFVPKIIKFINVEKDPLLEDKDLLYYIEQYKNTESIEHGLDL